MRGKARFKVAFTFSEAGGVKQSLAKDREETLEILEDSVSLQQLEGEHVELARLSVDSVI